MSENGVRTSKRGGSRSSDKEDNKMDNIMPSSTIQYMVVSQCAESRNGARESNIKTYEFAKLGMSSARRKSVHSDLPLKKKASMAERSLN